MTRIRKEWTVSEENFNGTEAVVRQLYGKKCQSVMYCTMRSTPAEAEQPSQRLCCHASHLQLRLYVRRANYKAAIWRSAIDLLLVILSPDKQSWEVDNISILWNLHGLDLSRLQKRLWNCNFPARARERGLEMLLLEGGSEAHCSIHASVRKWRLMAFIMRERIVILKKQKIDMGKYMFTGVHNVCYLEWRTERQLLPFARCLSSASIWKDPS